MRRQVCHILQHGPVNKTGAAGPRIFGQRVRYDRYVAQVGHLGHARHHPVMHVQISRTAAAPIQHGRARDALELHVLDHRLDGCKTGARCQQHHRFGAVFAQVKTAERAFNPHDFFFFHGTENMVGELATGHVANVQFDAGVLGLRVRRVGH